VDIDAERGPDTDEFPTEMLAAEHKIRRDDLIPEDFLFHIDISQELVKGGDALGETTFNDIPFRGGYDSRNQVEGKYPFDAGIDSVDGESNALITKKDIGHFASGTDIGSRKLIEPAHHDFIMRIWRTVPRDYLIEKALWL